MGRAAKPYSQTMFLSSYRDAVAFRPERFNAVPLAANQRVKAVLTCFEPGQFIPAHRPGVDMVLVVLEGEGVFANGEAEQPIGPGCTVFVPAGGVRGVKATTRMVALHVVTPPPTEADHREVAAALSGDGR